jgi:lipopolysaccharide export system protein LptA
MNRFQRKTTYAIIILKLITRFGVVSAQPNTSTHTAATPELGKKIICTADLLTHDATVNADVQILIGNVVFEHEGAVCHADTAYFNEVKNTIDAYGKSLIIHINDSLSLAGQHIKYDGNTKIAHIDGDVVLTDPKAVLYTQKLTYNRPTDIAYYNTSGRITNADNILVSQEGWFYTKIDQVYFRKDVVLTTPQYVVVSDTLQYDTQSEIAYFLGPTYITSEDSNHIYCEYGWYQTHTDVCEFQKNAVIYNQSQRIQGKTIWYDKANDMGIVKGDDSIFDAKENMYIKGYYAEYRSVQGDAYITDSAVAVMIENEDSLFLHADILHVTFDSVKEVETMQAYYHVKFYRRDLQGSCDSLTYHAKDSTIILINSPVLWSEENQLLADTVKMFVMEGQIREMVCISNASVFANVLAEKKFNQLKGELMIVYFVNKTIDQVFVDGSAECLYYVQEENKDLIGVQKSTSSQMRVFFEEGSISKIRFYSHVQGKLYPENQLQEDRLTGFIWLNEFRPKEKTDIFTPIIYQFSREERKE